jgi:trimeric autotransporter adhesin
MHSTKYAHCLRTGAAVSLATALSWIVLSQAHSGENPPAPFTASVQFAGPQPRFVVSWHAPADAQHFNVLMEDGNGNVAMLRNALTTSSAEFEFDVGLATDWNAAALRVEACNDIGCTVSADMSMAGLLADALPQLAYLKASSARAGDSAGTAVASSGDGRTMAFGTPDYDLLPGTLSNSGGAYVFVRLDNGNWSQQALLRPANSGSDVWSAGDRCGFSVALSDDGNTIAIGCPFEDGEPPANTETNRGAVYVYNRSLNNWTLRPRFRVSSQHGASLDQLGWSVALSADGNRLAGGAPSSTKSGGGAVYTFVRTSNQTDVWQERNRARPAGSHANDGFGQAVAFAANGETLLIGAPKQVIGNASHAGRAYVFLADASGWVEQARFSGSITDTQLGSSVSVDSQALTIALGAPAEQGSGAAYVYARSALGSPWVQQARLAPAIIGFDFGRHVSLSGSGNVLAVGVPHEVIPSSPAPIEAGFTRVYARSGNTWTELFTARALNAGRLDRFGVVALSRDGRRLFVGAPGEDGDANSTQSAPNDQAANAGASYVYDVPPL